MSNIVFAKVGTPEPPDSGFTKLFATETGLGIVRDDGSVVDVGEGGSGSSELAHWSEAATDPVDRFLSAIGLGEESFQDSVWAVETDEDNGGIVFSPKGVGSLRVSDYVNPEIGLTAVGGNRGLFSIDLQFLREQSNQVASGDFSFLIAGASNTASGASSGALGGADNRATGDLSAILAGRASLTLGPSSAIIGGEENIASGRSSVTIGGEFVLAQGDNSAVIGGLGTGSDTSERNRALGDQSVVIGGIGNVAEADNSVTLGGVGVVSDVDNSAVGQRVFATEALVARGSLSLGTDIVIADSSASVSGENVVVTTQNSGAVEIVVDAPLFGFTAETVPESLCDGTVMIIKNSNSSGQVDLTPGPGVSFSGNFSSLSVSESIVVIARKTGAASFEWRELFRAGSAQASTVNTFDISGDETILDIQSGDNGSTFVLVADPTEDNGVVRVPVGDSSPVGCRVVYLLSEDVSDPITFVSEDVETEIVFNQTQADSSDYYLPSISTGWARVEILKVSNTIWHLSGDLDTAVDILSGS